MAGGSHIGSEIELERKSEKNFVEKALPKIYNNYGHLLMSSITQPSLCLLECINIINLGKVLIYLNRNSA